MNKGGGKDPHSLVWTIRLLLCSAFFSVLISCNHHHQRTRAQKVSSSNSAAEEFADKLRTSLKPVDTTNRRKITSAYDNMRYAYQLNDYLPFWIENNKPNKDVSAYLDDLQNIAWDGLDPERYHFSALRKMNDELRANEHNDINKLITFDTTLTGSYIAAAHDLLLGAVSPKIADSLWYVKNDSDFHAPELLVNNEHYISLDSFRSHINTYKLLREQYRLYSDLSKNHTLDSVIGIAKNIKSKARPDSVEWTAIETIINAELPWYNANDASDSLKPQVHLLNTYQFYLGLKQTGKLDSATVACLTAEPIEMADNLKANMERLRWMPRLLPETYIVVNVPLMEFFFRKDGQDVMHMRVVVGKPIRQTPSLAATMANVVINPPWGVPPTILKKDVLPGITRDGRKYLDQKGLVPYDKKGHKVNPSSITPKNYDKFTYKQDPGDDNSLGYVKFNLPNPWDIYLHDTPHRDDFVKKYRALSSGCIRLQQPRELALYILGDLEKKRYDSARLDSMIQTHKTRWEILKNKIPVNIVYLTSFEDSTGAHIRKISDIYGRDQKLISLLK